MTESDTPVSLGNRIDQLERKVDLIAFKQDNMLEKVQTGFELQASKQDGHWKLVEQQLEMNTREQKQAITFLTEMAKESRSIQTQLEGDVLVLKGDLKAVTDDVTDIQDRLRWTSRTLVGLVVSVIVGLLVSGIVWIATH